MTDNTKITNHPNRWQHLGAKLGLFILFVTLAGGLLISCRVYGSYTTGIFSQPFIDPVSVESFSGLDCPPILNQNETGIIYTTIENRSGEEKVFSIDLAAHHGIKSVPLILSGSAAQNGFVLDGNVRRISGTLAAGETRRDSWQVRFPQGEAITDVSVVAYIDNGNGLYWGACGLAFTQLPGLTGGQIHVLILGGIPLGVLLWLYGRRRLGRLAFLGVGVTMILWLMIIVVLW